MPDEAVPTWNAIVTSAVMSLDNSRAGLSEAREWLTADHWRPADIPPTGTGAEACGEAARLISQATDLIDQAKEVLRAAGR